MSKEAEMTSLTTPTDAPTAATRTTRWPLERILFALAGSVTLLGALLSAVASPWFLLLAAFVGVNQWAFVLLHGCPASLTLKRFGAQSQCKW